MKNQKPKYKKLDSPEAMKAVVDALVNDIHKAMVKHFKTVEPRHRFLLGGRAVNSVFMGHYKPSIMFAIESLAEAAEVEDERIRRDRKVKTKRA